MCTCWRRKIKFHRCRIWSTTGSGLGPSLFLFYINDMPDDTKSTVRLSANDTIVYLTVSSGDNTLQEDLDKLAISEVKWMMKFHPDKCQVLAITKKKTPIKKNYYLHDHTLEHVPSAKKKPKEVNIEADHKLIPTNRKLWNTNSNCFQIP